MENENPDTNLNTNTSNSSADDLKSTPPISNSSANFQSFTAPKRKRPVWHWVLGLLLLVAIGLAAWQFINQEPKANFETVRHDVPLVKVAHEGFFNTFYPASGITVGEIELHHQLYEGLVTYEDQKSFENLHWN